MQKQLRIGVLHYHLLRGGVRTVITNTLQALITHGGYDLLEIDLITSDAQQTTGNELSQELLGHAQHTGPCQLRINQFQLNDLAYNDNPAAERDSLFGQATEITERLLQIMNLDRCDSDHPYILHVHNANLGKNPFLTLAIKLLADRLDQNNLPGAIIYQMHDFAENNRPQLLQNLNNCSGRDDPQLASQMMYPTSSRLHWICINSIDKQKLLSIGICPDCVTVLPNCLDVDFFSAPPLTQMSSSQLRRLHLTPRDFAAELKERLADFAQKNGFLFDNKRKILLAPVKAIRRKNITESILLMMALNANRDQYQLLVTLPANSSEDLQYSNIIENFVKKHQLPVVMGFGPILLAQGHNRKIKDGNVLSYSLIDLFDLCDGVVTTSIQEGFGYVFHEPWLADKFVFGRNIPHVTTDFIENNLNLDHLYDHLLLPRDWLGQYWQRICLLYEEKLNKIRKELELEPCSHTQIQALIEQNKTYNLLNHSPEMKNLTDWADLNLEAQLLLLQKIINKIDLKTSLFATNKSYEIISGWFPGNISDIIIENKKAVCDGYNSNSYARKLALIFGKTSKLLKVTTEISSSPAITNERLLRQSVELENIRLLA